jgi:hypothetical protein
MYVSVGTTSEGFKIATGCDCDCGGWTICRPARDVTEEYVESDDWARLCDEKLAERIAESPEAESVDCVCVTGAVCVLVATPLSDSRLLLAGRGLAPLGRATRLLRRSAK